MKIYFGKCTALNVLNLLPKAQKNLIDYPDSEIYRNTDADKTG
jgi:hypothetical protein